MITNSKTPLISFGFRSTIVRAWSQEIGGEFNRALKSTQLLYHENKQCIDGSKTTNFI